MSFFKKFSFHTNFGSFFIDHHFTKEHVDFYHTIIHANFLGLILLIVLDD